MRRGRADLFAPGPTHDRAFASRGFWPSRATRKGSGEEVKGDMVVVRNEYICISGPLPNRYRYKVYRSTSLTSGCQICMRPARGPTVHAASTNAHAYNTRKRELPISLQTRDVHSVARVYIYIYIFLSIYSSVEFRA